MILHSKSEAYKSASTRLGSWAREARNFGLDRAVLEVRCFDDCENLAITRRPGGAVVIDHPYRATSTIAGNTRLNLYGVSTNVADSLYLQPVHRIQGKRRTLRVILVVPN